MINFKCHKLQMALIFLLFVILAGCAVKCDDDNSNVFIVEVPDGDSEFTYLSRRSNLKIYWNVPTVQCHSRNVRFEDLYAKYGIIQNRGDTFRGEKISILYDPGLFPALLKNESSGKLVFRNGGVPQEGDLEKHLEEFRRVLNQSIPDEGFDGVGIVDFESWRPVFRQNFGTLDPYRQVSYDIERRRLPGAPGLVVHERARSRFEKWSRAFMEETLKSAREYRPSATWGYYGLPLCFNMAGTHLTEGCAPGVREENDRISWLWSSSTALFPSIYSSKSLSTNQLKGLIKGRLDEAARVSKNNEILPYFWYRYRDGGFISEKDLKAVLNTIHKSNATGLIIWGSSNDVNTLEKCQSLHKYIESTLGPMISRYTKTIEKRHTDKQEKEEQHKMKKQRRKQDHEQKKQDKNERKTARKELKEEEHAAKKERKAAKEEIEEKQHAAKKKAKQAKKAAKKEAKKEKKEKKKAEKHKNKGQASIEDSSSSEEDSMENTPKPIPPSNTVTVVTTTTTPAAMTGEITEDVETTVPAETANIVTTQAESTTTEAAMTTTEAAMTTTEAAMTTTEAVITTTEAVMTTTEAVMTTTEAEMTTIKTTTTKNPKTRKPRPPYVPPQPMDTTTEVQTEADTATTGDDNITIAGSDVTTPESGMTTTETDLTSTLKPNNNCPRYSERKCAYRSKCTRCTKRKCSKNSNKDGFNVTNSKCTRCMKRNCTFNKSRKREVNVEELEKIVRNDKADEDYKAAASNNVPVFTQSNKMRNLTVIGDGLENIESIDETQNVIDEESDQIDINEEFQPRALKLISNIDDSAGSSAFKQYSELKTISLTFFVFIISHYVRWI